VVATKYTLAMRPGDPNAAGNSREDLRSSVEASLRVIPILGARKLEQFQDVLGSLEMGYSDLGPRIDLPSTAPYRWRAAG
jgi:aryl-alcohol dehydrogenase-like predicted oxidoreductase